MKPAWNQVATAVSAVVLILSISSLTAAPAASGSTIPSPTAGGWQLNGSAALITSTSPPTLQLTAATAQEAGSAFWPTAVPSAGISAAFDISIGSGTGGADGETFTLADASVNTPTALGAGGGGEGFSGITGLAVSFDTYQNGADPSNNFVGIATGTGTAPDNLHYVATNTAIAALRNTVHHVMVTTTASEITVTMDGTVVLTYATTLPPSVLVGFTGGTGGYTDIHAVENVAITTGSSAPAKPQVTSLSPNTGPTTGGTAVTITGTNFVAGATVVIGQGNGPVTGAIAATNVTVVSSTKITATTGGGAKAGTFSLYVATAGGTSAANIGDNFTYTAPALTPTVSALSPNTGPTTGGTVVTITGTNLSGATAVSFGATAASSFSVKSGGTSLTATAPAGSGTVNVTVTTSGGTSAISSGDQFTYTTSSGSSPTVTGTNPNAGPTSGGSVVTITGTGLSGATAVTFGTVAAMSFTVNSNASITATAPPGSGSIDVKVTGPGGISTTSSADQFVYYTLAPSATYRGDIARSGYYPSESGLTQANAPTLKLRWTDATGGGSFAQPIVANSLVYWADWNGNEHGTNLSGQDVWSTNLGTTTDASCVPTEAGPSGTPTAVTVGTTPELFVPGGSGTFYALNALTGAIIWQTPLGSSPDHFLWSSPAVYNGNIYYGIASFGDCPLVQGQVVEMNLVTGALEHTFDTVPNSCTGAGVWGSPTVDAGDNSIYVTTGNPLCNLAGALGPSIVKLSATDLSLISSWTVPSSSQNTDSDFGATPTLFTATINGQVRSLVGAVNKNGVYYAFDRANLAAGPVWQTTVAGTDDDATGSSIVSAAFDGTSLYVGGNNADINNVTCTGNILALNPATGAIEWRNCVSGTVFGALTEVPGLIVTGSGSAVDFINTSTGATVSSFQMAAVIQGEITVSNGVVYMPLMNGSLVALGQ
jgi:hypothetical protein